MRETRVVMGMPIEVEISASDPKAAIDAVFEYFTDVDTRFSTYKEESEIMRINRLEHPQEKWSSEMKEVFTLAEKTRKETNGYFDIRHPSGIVDPSGIVKGWAIRNAARSLAEAGYEHFYINAGGDIASRGMNGAGKPWSVGIQNPFQPSEIVKVVYPRGEGVATSGSYVRGSHIYDPHDHSKELTEIVSVTVIGPDVFEADRFATAAFAMGRSGIEFLEGMKNLEAYQIDASGLATMTSGFERYTKA